MPTTIEGIVYYTEAELTEARDAASAGARKDGERKADRELRAAQDALQALQDAHKAIETEKGTLASQLAEKDAQLSGITREKDWMSKLVGAGYGYTQSKLLANLPALAGVDLASEDAVKAALAEVAEAFPSPSQTHTKPDLSNLSRGGKPADATPPVATDLRSALAAKYTAPAS
jgi:hypothetical protein